MLNEKKEISTLKPQAADLANQGCKEIEKIDELEQYGRRQNLEIAGVPQQPNKNTNSIMIKVAKLLNVVVLPDHISTLHRLPKRPNQSQHQRLCLSTDYYCPVHEP